MTFLLDTNVIGELRKPEGRADANVRSWVASRRPAELFLSVITVLEIEVGIGRLELRDRAQAQRLRMWLTDEVLDSFAGQILSVDLRVARRAARMHVPDPRPERDTLIAATAAERNMIVVSRNVNDFLPTGVQVIDPWLSS